MKTFTQNILYVLLICMTAATEHASAVPAAVSGVPVAPRRAVVTPVKDFTAGQCAQLGGTVQVELYGICASALVCVAKDENQKTHMVCLTKK